METEPRVNAGSEQCEGADPFGAGPTALPVSYGVASRLTFWLLSYAD